MFFENHSGGAVLDSAGWQRALPIGCYCKQPMNNYAAAARAGKTKPENIRGI